MGRPETTRETIEAAQSGAVEARELLVARYREPLDHYIRLRVGGHLRGKVEVEDVSQETFAKAFQAIQGFQWRGADSFLLWLKRISENVILNLAKKHRRDQVLFVDEADVFSRDGPPSRAARRDERFERLQASLDRLSPDYREVIVLARLKGLRLREVARRMNRSPNAVAHLLSRALKQLKETFGDTESLSLPPRSLDPLAEGEKRDGQ